MSQVTHPTVSLPTQARSRKAVVLAGVLALLATAAVVIALVLANDDGSKASVAPANAQPALRSDGGPNESAVAAAIGSQPTAGPDESSIASSISGR